MSETMLTRADDEGCEPYDSIRWAFDVHVKTPDTGEFNFAIMYGYGDPERIEFWRSPMPNYDDAPDYVWNNPVFAD